jgi:hypothetical protein
LVLALLWAGTARAAGDYAPRSADWNGLSRLVEIAAAAVCTVEPTERLAWDELGARDVLWFVFPRSPVEPHKLKRWLAGGGRVVLADDFGAAADAFAALDIRRARSAVEVAPAERFQGNPALPVAQPVYDTELARSTAQLVANHPASFESPFAPTFAFSRGQALVIEERLGRGYLVAIADPSVFINNMLQLDGNAAFARALVERTCGAGRDRILLVTQTFSARGEPPAEVGAPDDPRALAPRFNGMLGDLNRWLRAGGDDARMLTVVAVFLALAGAALLAGSFPARQRVDDHWTQARRLVGETAGWQPLAGLPWDYGLAAALVREEALDRLRAALGGALDFDWTMPQQLAEKVRGACGPQAARLAADLWRLLHRLRWRTVDGETAPDERVSRRQFLKLHELAVPLFEALSERPGPFEV